jgi:monovalent cation:proton antiporter-2 (CPA2) family protein
VSETVLTQALVYLAAAVLCVPLAKRLGLGSVLGYLLAGIAIGPGALGLVGHGAAVMHFAELGVVMMLFLVGLELRPSILWTLRRPIFGLGGLQVAGTAGVIAAVAVALGFDWRVGVAVGLILAMSSTAIVLQTLGEKGLLKSPGGQASFSVLLFQDVSVIPILALFPLLATAGAPVASGDTGRPGWLQGLFILGAVTAIGVLGRLLVRPAFRFLAETRLREVFTASSLLLVLAIVGLMQLVGLSPALGTFLAGVVLADSEYRHELESDIEPFKGLLLGLFFISVGAEIDFRLIIERPLLVTGAVAAVLVVKTLVLLVLGRAFALDRPARWLSALGLSQVGEFAFVLIGFGQQTRIFGVELAGPLVAVVALSMLVTPALFIFLERVLLPRLAAGTPARPHDEVAHEEASVVMAGFGRVGQVVGRLLRMAGYGVTVLDLDPTMVDLLRRLGQKVYYGDASRLDLLVSAGCERARLFVLAIDEPEKSLQVAELVRRNFPELPILARARNREHYYGLRHLGITHIFRETLGSSLELGQAALAALGVRAHTAHRIAVRWRQHDERALEAMLEYRSQGEDVWVREARRALENTEKTMREEIALARSPGRDPGWDDESLREEARDRGATSG